MSFPRLLPKLFGNQPPAEPEPLQPNKRRRGKFHTACNPCRDKREKCSGRRPVCHSCERLGRQCVYAAPEGVTRQQANKQRLAEIEQTNSSLRDVVDLLRQGSEADAAVALRRIRQAEQVDEAINVLAAAQTLVPTIPTLPVASSLNLPLDETSSTYQQSRPFERSRSSSTHRSEHIPEEELAQTRDRYNENDTDTDVPASYLPISQWTSASKDDRLMNHLLALFWTWDNLVEPSLFRPLFEEDLCNHNSTFCSPFLVNALLALSCLFTTVGAAFSDPEDMTTRGQMFAAEAERHLDKEMHHPSIPLLQGQFAMFVYQGNLDGGSKSIDYFMHMIATYEDLNNDDLLDPQNHGNKEKSDERLQKEMEGASWVMWGIYCVEWRASQAFGFQKPVAKPIITKLWQGSTFPLCQSDSVSYWWSPYPESRGMQRSMKVEIREANVQLAEIAEQVLEYLYPLSDSSSEHPAANPSRAVELYDTLIRWKLTLPARLRLEDAVLPNAILLHSYAELLLANILRPCSQFSKIQFGPFSPKRRCHDHCVSLLDTIWTFRAFTSLHGEYWYIPLLATVSLMTFQDHTDRPMLTGTLIKACKCLDEMSLVYPLAADALSAIRGAFKRTETPIPKYLEGYLGNRVGRMKDGLLHHAAARLMPHLNLCDQTGDGVRYQELLDELDDIELEGS